MISKGITNFEKIIKKIGADPPSLWGNPKPWQRMLQLAPNVALVSSQTWDTPVASGPSLSRYLERCTLTEHLSSSAVLPLYPFLSVVPLSCAGEWYVLLIKLGRRHHVCSEKIKFCKC